MELQYTYREVKSLLYYILSLLLWYIFEYFEEKFKYIFINSKAT